MDTEDAIIIALVILIAITGAVAFFVTTNGISFTPEEPVVNHTNNTTANLNVTKMTENDSDISHDTGISAPSESSSYSSSGYSNYNYNYNYNGNSYNGGSSSDSGGNTPDPGGDTPDPGGDTPDPGGDTPEGGGSDSGGDG